MAGRKDFEWTAVITNISGSEASAMRRDIIKSTKATAPHSRGTAAMGKSENVGRLLQRKVSGWLH